MDQALISESLDRICDSAPFARSKRMQHFLRYIVEQSSTSGSEGLKEYAIAITVYQKDPTFDPRIDPIVRVEASRLRLRLMEYYAGEGSQDRLVIDIPKGSYQPVFRVQDTKSRPEIQHASPVGDLPMSSLAVLPFENATGDPQYDYIAGSIAELLVAEISQSATHHVCPAVLSRNYKAKFDPTSVALELGVGSLLIGRFTLQNNWLLAAVELVDAQERRLSWSSRIVCHPIGTANLLEDVVLRTIWWELAPKLMIASRLPKTSTLLSSEAYRLYSKGRYAWNKRTKAGLMAAVEFYGKSLQIDPSSAIGYAGLADSYIALGTFGSLAPHQSFPRGIAAALKALALDPDLGEARVSLATAQAFFETDWEIAGEGFREALRRNPKYATGHQWYGCYLFAQGRTAEAIDVLKVAQELDPLSPMVSTQLASAYFFNRQHDLARELCLGVLDMDSQFWAARWFLGMALEQLGEFGEALQQLRSAVSGSEQTALAIAALAHCLVASGESKEAERLLSELMSRARKEYVSSYCHGIIAMGLGRTEETLELLDAAQRENSPMPAMFLKVDPRFDSLRSHARFVQIMQRLHLHPDF